jgi:hypothetical protein
VTSSPDFDADIAADLIGCTLLVGVSYFGADGALRRREQFWGIVEACDPGAGISLKQADGEIRWLPPLTVAIKPADPGDYRLKGTGEVVTDPDFTAIFSVTAPD